jgi:N-acetylmuramoyl-L-alanine amidase
MQLLGAMGLEGTFRPAGGDHATRVGRTPLRIGAGRPAIDYGGHVYHTGAAARAAGDDLLLPEEFLGPLRAAFIESGEDPAPGADSFSPAPSALGTVVIDPGHGGANTGAKGPGGFLEKDLTLAVSVRLARLLREEIGCRVVLTRETDQALSLPERTAIANRERAGLFVSVHANASPPARDGLRDLILSATASDANPSDVDEEK